MRDTLKKGMALGLGLAVTSKEQAEKLIDELVKKGELTRQESSEFMDDLLKKGKESQKDIDEKIQKRFNQLFDDLHVATKEDVKALEKRVNQLEEQLNKSE